ncbi:MAG: HD domain-containing phosphohydrolase [Thermodesulfobacteriota bacterium]
MSEILHILVVEDNPADVDLIRETLPDAGPVRFRIEAVSRLSEALSRLKSEGIDLVLLDLGLPDSRGLDTFRALRDAAPQIPVIILTGNSDQEVAVAAVKEGAQDYLIKGDVGERTLILASLYAVERTRAAKALRKSEEYFKAIIQNASDIILIVDKLGTVTYASPSLERFLGYRPEEWIGKRSLDLIVAEDKPRAMEDFGKALQMKEPVHNRFRMRHKDGTERILEGIGRNLLDDPIVAGFVMNIRDITEGAKAAEREKEAADRLEILFLSNPTGLLLINARTRVITSANQAALDIMESAREEVIGQVCHTFVCPAELHCCPILDKGLSTDRSEKVLIAKNNRPVPIIKSVVQVNIDNEPYLLESFIDDTERKRGEEQLQSTLESLRKAFGTIIQVMVAAVESRDPYTAGHQTRSADLARAIATEMGLPQQQIDAIRMAGTIHDIGKLSIPAEILSKPTRLTEIEFSLIQEHARKGFEMLKDVESPWPLAEIVYQHHERMDGSGYPRNLKGEEILIEARILAVADVVEAMASHRPYRPGLGIDIALGEIEKNRGLFYDDAVADACLKLFREKGFRLAGI